MKAVDEYNGVVSHVFKVFNVINLCPTAFVATRAYVVDITLATLKFCSWHSTAVDKYIALSDAV